jgi:hypothetical protein
MRYNAADKGHLDILEWLQSQAPLPGSRFNDHWDDGSDDDEEDG